MTDTNKYYTPEIDEFHVGTHYQFNTEGEAAGGQWVDAVIKDGAQIDDIFRKYKNGIPVYDIRCKRLDHDDIITAGWAQDLSDSRSTCFIKRVENETHYLWFFDNGTILIFKNNKYGHREDLFSGTLRNKSDLKLLMKQLGI